MIILVFYPKPYVLYVCLGMLWQFVCMERIQPAHRSQTLRTQQRRGSRHRCVDCYNSRLSITVLSIFGATTNELYTRDVADKIINKSIGIVG